MEQQVIPKGYKQTEVGVIPVDWEVKQVQDVCGFIVPGRNKPKVFDGSIPWITTPDLKNKTVVYESRISLKISKKEAKSVGSQVVPTGSVIMSCVGDLGIVSISGCDMVLNQQLHAFLPSKKVNCFYLAEAIRAQTEYIYSVATKTALPYVNKDNCNSIPIALPNIEEQTAIANALSDVDALIASIKKLIAKKQAIKTATMQQLLTGKKRLPPFDKHPDGTPKGTQQTELGEIPEDWEVVSLGSAANFINGRAYAIHEWETSGTPVIRLQNLTGRGENYYYSNLKLPEKQYCNYGDLLFMWSATFGPVIWKGDKAIYHYHIWKVESNELSNKDFLYFVLSEMTDNLKRGSSSGGTMLHVTKSMMESTSFICPPKQEQIVIADLLTDMNKELSGINSRLDKTKKIKQGMMQELLTGKTRLV